MSFKETARAAGQLAVELGPVAVFMASYNVIRALKPDHALFAVTGTAPADAIYLATGLFMAATALAVAFSWVRARRIPPVLLIMAGLVIGFGGLTVALRDPIYIKIQPTLVNLFYALAIFGSLLAKQNIWKLLFRHAFTLPDKVWDVLAWRWGVFFLFMAGLNEVVRLTQPEAVWVNFRFYGALLTILFMAANLPITIKHIGKTDMPLARPKAPLDRLERPPID